MRYICPKCRRELSVLQLCPWCARVAAPLDTDTLESLRAERDAALAECERLHVALGRLLRAAQSLHRAWRRERDLVMRFRRDHDEWAVSPECGCLLCEETDRSHGREPRGTP